MRQSERLIDESWDLSPASISPCVIHPKSYTEQPIIRSSTSVVPLRRLAPSASHADGSSRLPERSRVVMLQSEGSSALPLRALKTSGKAAGPPKGSPRWSTRMRLKTRSVAFLRIEAASARAWPAPGGKSVPPIKSSVRVSLDPRAVRSATALRWREGQEGKEEHL